VFTGAIEFANGPVAVEQSWGVPEGAILLNYAAVLGPGTVAERSRGGNGTIATLRAVCTAPIEAGRIAVFDNSVHQTRVVLSDGRTELRALPPVDLQLTSTESAPTSGTDAAARSGNESWGHIKQRGRR